MAQPINCLLDGTGHWGLSHLRSRNKCIATSNKCFTSSNKKQIQAISYSTRNKCLTFTSWERRVLSNRWRFHTTRASWDRFLRIPAWAATWPLSTLNHPKEVTCQTSSSKSQSAIFCEPEGVSQNEWRTRSTLIHKPSLSHSHSVFLQWAESMATVGEYKVVVKV